MRERDMADEISEQLREAALHRGYKLLRSRRRKPGTGDYGKFGLTDDQGKPLIGVGEGELTATAAEIEDFLRAGAASTWKQSAKITAAAKSPAAERAAQAPEVRQPPAKAEPAGPKSRASKSRPKPIEARREPPKPEKTAAPSRSRPRPVPEPPALRFRPAKPADAEAIASLLRQLRNMDATKAGVVKALTAARKSGAELFVAEQGEIVGCAAWAVLPTIHRGNVGRITLLVVDDSHRRKGIGTGLLNTAMAAFAKSRCVQVEVMSDVDLKNSHNFFRDLGFVQTSYRFARDTTATGAGADSP